MGEQEYIIEKIFRRNGIFFQVLDRNNYEIIYTYSSYEEAEARIAHEFNK